MSTKPLTVPNFINRYWLIKRMKQLTCWVPSAYQYCTFPAHRNKYSLVIINLTETGLGFLHAVIKCYIRKTVSYHGSC